MWRAIRTRSGVVAATGALAAAAKACVPASHGAITAAMVKRAEAAAARLPAP